MHKYICNKSNAEVEGIMKRINTKHAVHELYVTKARTWLKTHHIGNIVKGWVLHKQLELVARDGERLPMLFTVSLDSGSTSVVRGREKDLLQNDF